MIAEYVAIADMVTLIIALFENTKIELDKLIPLITKTITIMIESMVIEANAIAIVIKNVFKTRCSFDLYATTIEKKIIDKNIKNSIMIRTMNKVKIKTSEKFPDIRLERKIFKVSKNVGETNIIKIEIIRQAKAQRISIRLVKYFELISSFFVTGRV